MMNKEAEKKLKEYEEHFDEELSLMYTCKMTDERIIEVVNECIEKNVVYSKLLRMMHGDIII